MVTGATGLVGSHLVERLIERRDEVHALIRNRAKARPIDKLGAILVEGDLTKPESLRSAMRDFDVLYHCAAQVSLPHQGNRDHILNINVQGTRDIVRAAIDAGVKRFVLVSSVAVYGGSSDMAITEDHSYDIEGYYSESKVRAEEAMLGEVSESSMEWVILRPCVIYGPRDLNFLPEFAELYGGKFFPLVNGGNALMDLVYVTDVCEALILAGTCENAHLGIYNVTDGEQHSVKQIVETMQRIWSRPSKTFNVPYPVAHAFAAVSSTLSRIIKPSEDPLVSPAGVKHLTKPHNYSIEKIQRELGYRPQVTLEEGLRLTIEWYENWKSNGTGSAEPSLQGGH